MRKTKAASYTVDFIALVVIVLSFIAAVKFTNREANHPANWMIVSAVSVPDHRIGDDPMIVYDRTVFQEFDAQWIADVYSVEGEEIILLCTGDGFSHYDPEEKLGQVPLYAWYLERECGLNVGNYVIKTRWITTAGVIIRNTSNVFKVSEWIPDEYIGD